MTLLLSRAEDDELARWQDPKFWAVLAARWYHVDPDTRTKEQARHHLDVVREALGIGPAKGGAS